MLHITIYCVFLPGGSALRWGNVPQMSGKGRQGDKWTKSKHNLKTSGPA